jgi:hypothetical protein
MNSKLLWATLLSAGAIALSAMPTRADGVLFKARVEGTNSCHMKFPAIREETLSWDRPVLKDPSSGDIIHFFGSCDHDPLGKDEIADQRRANIQDRRGDGDDS